MYSTLRKAAQSVESMSGDISGQEDKHLQPHKYALLCPQIGETYKIHNSETYIQKNSDTGETYKIHNSQNP